MHTSAGKRVRSDAVPAATDVPWHRPRFYLRLAPFLMAEFPLSRGSLLLVTGSSRLHLPTIVVPRERRIPRTTRVAATLRHPSPGLRRAQAERRHQICTESVPERTAVRRSWTAAGSASRRSLAAPGAPRWRPRARVRPRDYRSPPPACPRRRSSRPLPDLRHIRCPEALVCRRRNLEEWGRRSPC